LAGLARHVSREPRALDRGFAFGAALAREVGRTVALYRSLLQGMSLREAGSGVRLPDELMDEVEGIASGAGVNVFELLAVNARTELLAGGCSVVARGSWLAQTWDWHPSASPVIWTVCVDGGWLCTVTEAGMVGKLGLNSWGVSCGFNYLRSSVDGAGGMPVHALARAVLSCRSATSARACLGAASASVALTVAAPDGLFCAEVSPGGVRFVSPEPDGWLVHTNHFLLPPVRGEDAQVEPGTLARREQLLRRMRAGWSVDEALAEAPVCRHEDGEAWAERRATLLAMWSEPGRLRVASGLPCETAFVDVALP
jgi:isopenicillin-N N-acyltransferase-like protein